MLLVGVALLAAMFWLFLGQTGKELQLKWLGTYLPVEGVVRNNDLQFDYGSGGNKTGDGRNSGIYLYIFVDYAVDGENYSQRYEAQYWYSIFDEEEAKLFMKDQFRQGDSVTIYYDPNDPTESVLYPEDELHLWLIFLLFLPVVTVSTIVSICGAGGLFSRK